MPQFDKIMFISQLFWLTASFCLLYQIMLQIFLPQISAIFKVRRIVLHNIFGGGNTLVLDFARSYFASFASFNLLLSRLQTQTKESSFDSASRSLATQRASATSSFLSYYLSFLLREEIK
jgi:hypothetical protein